MSERKPIVVIGGELQPLPPGDTIAGAMSEADKTKLDTVETGAQKNVGVEYTPTEKTKLAGIAPGAQANVGVEFTPTEKAKLAGVAEGAEVNDATVSQGVAEAGTSTVRVGWSSLRVRQAIAAWWAALTVDASKVTTGVFNAARIPVLNQDTTGRAGVATSADKLTTPRMVNGSFFDGTDNVTTARWGAGRTISFIGDLTGSDTIDGSANAAFSLTLAATGVAAGTYAKVTVDGKGRVTAGASLGPNDMPANADLTGLWTVPSAATNTSNGQIASTAFVQAVVAEAQLGGGGEGEITAVQVKALYESNDNTNAFTDAEKAKLLSLTVGGEANYAAVTQAAAVAGESADLSSWSALRVRQAIIGWYDGTADKTKLAGIEAGAQVNPTAATGTEAIDGTSATVRGWSPARITQLVAAWWAASPAKTKLDGIAANADVTPGIVPQLEAEDGSSATGYIWSPQRISQALQAWWASLTIEASKIPTLNQNTTGSAAKWASPRNLTIGDATKSIDGSADVTFTAEELGISLPALTASRAVVSDSAGALAVSSVTATELGHLSGVASAIQTQLNGKAPLGTLVQINSGEDNSVALPSYYAGVTYIQNTSESAITLSVAAHFAFSSMYWFTNNALQLSVDPTLMESTSSIRVMLRAGARIRNMVNVLRLHTESGSTQFSTAAYATILVSGVYLVKKDGPTGIILVYPSSYLTEPVSGSSSDWLTLENIPPVIQNMGDAVVSTANTLFLIGTTGAVTPLSVSANALTLLGQTYTAMRTSMGAAPLVSPALTGSPTAPTQAVTVSNTTLATTAHVTNKLVAPGGSIVQNGNIIASQLTNMWNTTRDIMFWSDSIGDTVIQLPPASAQFDGKSIHICPKSAAFGNPGTQSVVVSNGSNITRVDGTTESTYVVTLSSYIWCQNTGTTAGWQWLVSRQN